MHKAMRSLFILLVMIGSTLMVGCGSSVPVVRPFKMDIQQGNVVTSKMLLQLRPGMTKSQVKFIMGTPLVNDSFHINRWDYFYQMRRSGKIIEQRRVILDFDNELLARVRGDVVPQGTPGADTGAVTLSNESSTIAAPVAKEGLLENLKFWKSNQEPAAPSTAKPVIVQPSTEKKSAPEAQPATPTKEPALSAEPVTAPLVSPDAVLREAPASEKEAPSMLAVPIDISPKEVAPSTVTPVESESAAKGAVKLNLDTTAPMQPKSAPATPDPSANGEERKIFRLDRKLDAESVEKAKTVPAEQKVKANSTDEKAVPAEEPGYFERMLEKIGF